jgi:hypothetical protein
LVWVVAIYGWIYGLENSLIKELDSTTSAFLPLDDTVLYDL